MNNNTACAAYFRQHAAYRRCLKECWKKWRSYGRVAGIITLKQCSEEEKREIGGMLGKIFYEDEIRFSFTEFDRGLQKTKYAPVDIKKVLESYFEKPLTTKQEQKEQQRYALEQFFRKTESCLIKKTGDIKIPLQWLQKMQQEKTCGYQLLIREYKKDAAKAEELLIHVCEAMLSCERLQQNKTECQLAVFAADITGNPHYFDRGSAAGQLLLHAICYSRETEVPQTAHQWRDVLWEVGIIADTISSIVHAYGLHLKTATGYHPAYEAFCEKKEVCVITLENLKGIVGAKPEGGCVYIVENEMVFSFLVAELKNEPATILCTSGQPRAVAVKLIRLLADNGICMKYSGDIDPDGIAIADRLWMNNKEHMEIWRMGPEDYEDCLSAETIGALGIAKLENISHPGLKQTAELVRKKKLAGYQENLRVKLLDDMRNATYVAR